MALIDNYYVHVEEEEATLSSEVTQHPVETGIKVTDNVKRQPITLPRLSPARPPSWQQPFFGSTLPESCRSRTRPVSCM